MCAFCLLPDEEKYSRGVFKRNFEEYFNINLTLQTSTCVLKVGKRHVEIDFDRCKLTSQSIFEIQGNYGVM